MSAVLVTGATGRVGGRVVLDISQPARANFVDPPQGEVRVVHIARTFAVRT